MRARDAGAGRQLRGDRTSARPQQGRACCVAACAGRGQAAGRAADATCTVGGRTGQSRAAEVGVLEPAVRVAHPGRQRQMVLHLRSAARGPGHHLPLNKGIRKVRSRSGTSHRPAPICIWMREDLRAARAQAKALAMRGSQVPGGSRSRGTKSWCCRTGLNCRPLPYQGSALPLSYGSRSGETRQITAGNGAILATRGQAAQARLAPRQPNRARCSFASGPAFCRSASLSSTFLIRSAAKSCWASAIPRSNTSL